MTEANFKIAENSASETLVEFIWEFYKFEHLKFDKSLVCKGLAKILQDDSLGRVWPI